jgi:hypothetical protein
MWFRIVFYDRQMCLILGMPQGTTDQNIACDAILANDTASGRLERVHCVIAARILERNDSESTIYDYSWTKSLDKELQRAARRLPSRWWLIPNLSGEPKDSKALFWEMRRLSAQLLHYNLFNQIHLPYMIRHSDERKFEYSRHTCVNSSREILSRFIMLRRWNQVAFSCRTIDFTALMAAITLLLAHLDNHRSSQEENLLAPQYLGDRAMIEQAQENMEELNRLNPDTLSSRSAQLLKRLLAIEAMAAEGDLQSAQSVSVQGHEMEEPQSESMASSDKNVYIPYFGVIKGAGEIHACATSSKVQCMPPANTRQTQLPIFEQGEPEAKRSMHSTFVATSVHPESHSSYQHNKNNRNSTAKYIPALLTPLLSGVLLDDPMQQVSTAGMASSLGDDVFQDLDLAFLDNLLGGNNEDEQGSAEWNAT